SPLAATRIRDGFELALLGADGRPLVPVIGTGRDAFFYTGEGLPSPVRAQGVTVRTDAATGEVVVSLSVAGLLPGTAAKLVARLVNNDGDTATEVKVMAPVFTSDSVAAPWAPLAADPGAASGAATLDWTQYVPVSAGYGVTTVYNTASWTANSTVLSVETGVKNEAASPRYGRHVVVVKGISDASVRVLNADGLTPAGEPYFDFGAALTADKLNSDEISKFRTIQFSNPNGAAFTWSAGVHAVPNKAPVWSSTPVTSGYFGVAYLYLGQAVDPEGGTLAYTLVSGPSGMAVDAASGRVTWTPPAAVTADTSYGVTLRATDNMQAVADQSFTLTVRVAPPNRPPQITGAPHVAAVVGQSYTTVLRATDPDGDALSFALETAPDGLAINVSTGALSWTPTLEQTGNHTVTARVSDGQGGVTRYTFIATVQDIRNGVANRPPVFTSIPPTHYILERDSFGAETVSNPLEYKAIAVDPDGDVVTYSSDDPYLIDEQGNLSWNFGFYAYEPTVHRATITARDGRGGVATQQLEVLVTGADPDYPPEPPLLQIMSIPKTTAVAGQPYEYRVKVISGGNSAVRYAVSSDRYNIYIDEVTGVLKWSPLTEDVGLPAFVSITVYNRNYYGSPTEVGSVSQSFEIEVLPADTPNQAPAITSTVPDTAPVAGTVWKYQVETVDVDADPLRYRLLASAPDMTVDAESGLITWLPETSLPGTYKVIIQVSDDRGGVDKQEFTVSTGVNTPPVFLTPSLLDYQKIDFGGRTESLRGAYSGFTYSGNTNCLNVPFDLSPNPEMWWAAGDTSPNPHVLEIDVDKWNASEVHTLITTGWGKKGPESLLYLEFLGDQGAYYRKDLVGDIDIRDYDYISDSRSNFINGTTTRNVFHGTHSTYTDWGFRPTDTWLDKQQIVLPPEFLTQKLKSVRVVDIGADFVQRAQFSGITVLATGGREGVVLQGGAPFAYRFSAQDAEQEGQLTYSLVGAPGGMAINGQSGEVTWTAPTGTDGWFPVKIVAEDGRGGRAELPFAFRVRPEVGNFAPKIVSEPKTKVRFGSVYRSVVAVEDANGDPITFELLDAPAGMAIAPSDGKTTATGFLTWTPTSAQLGTHNVTISVTDGRSAPVTQSFTVEVLGQQVNSMPVVVSHPPLVAVAGRSYTYDILATDADHDALQYRAALPIPGLGDGSVVPLPYGVSLSPIRGTLRWVPSTEQMGVRHFAVDVTDQQGGLVRHEWDVRVQGANQPPMFISTPVTEAAVATAYTYPVQVTDPEGDSVRFSLTGVIPQGMVISPTTGIITWKPATASATPQMITVRADDGFGGVSEQIFGVVALAAPRNQPPVIVTSPLRTTDPGVTYTQTFQGSDPEGGALTWSLAQAPAGMSIAPTTGELTWTAGAVVNGVHPVTVLAADPQGASTVLAYQINVSPNLSPILGSTPPVTTARTNVPYESWFDAVDANGDALTYRVVSGPPGLTIDSTGHIHWTTPAAPGSYTITVAVSDGRGGEIEQTYTLVTE
ncbi:hypothetical protein DB346_13195, partial [Verrucomicrobia bacterium LW23]